MDNNMKSGTKNLIDFTFQKNILWVFVLYACVILLGIINGVAYTEALRRMTQSVWEREWDSFVLALYGFGAIILLGLILNIGKRRFSFLLKKKLTFACEDVVYENFSGKEYWRDAQEENVLGHFRKTVPDTMNDVVEQGIHTANLCTVILVGYLYGASLNGLVMAISFAVTVFMVWLSQKKAGNVSELYQEFGKRNSRLYQLLWEQVKNREIARFLNPDKVLYGYEKEIESYLNVLLKIKKATNGAGLFSQFGSTVLIMLVAFLGGTMALRQRMSFADLLALLMLIPSIASQMFRVPSLIQQWKKVTGNCKNIDALLEETEQFSKRSEKLEWPVRSLEIAGLCFSYGGEKQVLQKVMLNVKKDVFYVLAGNSGSGKSTLLKCIAGLLFYEEGKILINGMEQKTLNRDVYWEKMSYIGQEPFILDGTLLYNITLQEDGRRVEQKRLEQAIRIADMESFVGQKQEGLERYVSAESLSKGERAKVNIARAVYRKVQLLLLDEMTEGLDPQTEIRILKALKCYGKEEGILCLCISHHIETQRSADRVMFMEDGRITAVGTYEELCLSCEPYCRMVGRMER